MDAAGLELGLMDIFWVFFIALFFIPLVRRRLLLSSRTGLIKKIEAKNNSRVITLIHRQEAMNLLGFSFAKFISIDDSERVLTAIRMTPKETPIDFIVHTPGGLVLAATQIALALKKHPGEVRVIVPHYAMSGGSLIALAADRIIMDENAVLGPVDPQISSLMRMYPAASLMAVAQLKDPNQMDDETIIYADVAKKALAQVRKLVCTLLEGSMPSGQAFELCQKLTEGYWTHDHPLTVDDLKDLHLHVSTGISSDIFKLINLYPQPSSISPAVEYIPVPYKKQGK